MMKKIVDSITEWLICNADIDQSEKEIYELEAIVIFLGFLLLQRYAGSYHASTRISCFVESMLILAGDLFLIQIIELSEKIQFILLIISVSGVLIMAPVENVNKKLDALEKRVYHKRTVYSCIVYIILWGLSIFKKRLEWGEVILIILFDVMVLQMAGIFFNERKRIHNK